jgi:transcriptional repressor NrdR
MHCPFCGVTNSKVIDSRESSDGNQIRRRRECLGCQTRFTTYETAELTLPRIVKRDDVRESFSDDKLRAGFQKALEKRPVSSESIEAMVNNIRKKLLAVGDREVKSRVLGEWVMEELKAVDKVAYIRFASVYRSFQDLSEFREVIERLEANADLK